MHAIPRPENDLLRLNLLETFSIAEVSNVCDLAYDGEFFYGAAANTTVFVMDFNTHTLITSFTAPTAVRAIAYNEDNQTFYANNWSTDIVNFDATGTTLGLFTSGLTGIYGLAYDKWSEPGNMYLWTYDQGANNLIQLIPLAHSSYSSLPCSWGIVLKTVRHHDRQL